MVKSKPGLVFTQCVIFTTSDTPRKLTSVKKNRSNLEKLNNGPSVIFLYVAAFEILSLINVVHG
jgi:hypothetical protein